MTHMNPYPEAAEVADSHLSKAVDTLTATTREGFRDVKDQLQWMATKDAVHAQVARLDNRVDHTNERMDTRFEVVEKKLVSGFSELKARDSERDAAATKRDEERDKKFARRMTWTLTVVGLAFTAFTMISNLIS